MSAAVGAALGAAVGAAAASVAFIYGYCKTESVDYIPAQHSIIRLH